MKRFTPLSLLCLLGTAASLPLNIDTAVKLGKSVVDGSTGSLYFVPEGSAVVQAAAQVSPVVVLRPQPSPQFFGSYGGFGGYNNFLQQQPIYIQVPAPAPALLQVPAPVSVPVPTVVAPAKAPLVAPETVVAPAPAPAVAPVPAPAPAVVSTPALVPRPAPVPVYVPAKAPAAVAVKPAAASVTADAANPGIPAEYTYNYVIKGDNGDVKGAQETRKGDKVSGQYTINDPDGTTRVVTYTVDGDSGFVANVETKKGGAPFIPKALKEGEIVSGNWATDFKAPNNIYNWNEKVQVN